MRLRFSAVVLGVAAILGLAGLASGWQVPAPAPTPAPEKAKDVPSPGDAKDKKAEPAKREVATFGGGCFWCLEAVFERIKGVKAVVSGYAGGNTARPSYQMVCTGLTGHAEVVQIEYDPAIVSYEDLLDIFWICHDPTTLNRQGPDEGTQYRSVVLYHDEAQKKAAQKSYEKATSARLYSSPIVTELVPFTKFYPAEKHHQDYYRKNRAAEYCQMIIAPKLREMQAKLNAKARAKAQ